MMFEAFFRATAFAICFSTVAPPVAAATMNFDSVNIDYLAKTYSEDGIFASGNGTLGLYAGSMLHFDDGGTSAPSTVTFSMSTLFNAVSFLLDPVHFDFFVSFEDGSYIQPTYTNVQVQGYQGAALVADLKFDMGSSLDPYKVKLGNSFSSLSSLVISILYPNVAEYRAMPGVRYAGGCAPCSHFNIDNVKLSPVPLPAGLPLAASGLALLAFAARRRAQSPQA
jgi:hypothetical protein